MHNGGEDISEDFLWARLEPLLDYLPAEQRAKVSPSKGCLAASRVYPL